MINRRALISSIAFGATGLVAGASLTALPALAGNGNGNGNGNARGNGKHGKYPHRNQHRRNIHRKKRG